MGLGYPMACHHYAYLSFCLRGWFCEDLGARLHIDLATLSNRVWLDHHRVWLDVVWHSLEFFMDNFEVVIYLGTHIGPLRVSDCVGLGTSEFLWTALV